MTDSLLFTDLLSCDSPTPITRAPSPCFLLAAQMLRDGDHSSDDGNNEDKDNDIDNSFIDDRNNDSSRTNSLDNGDEDEGINFVKSFSNIEILADDNSGVQKLSLSKSSTISVRIPSSNSNPWLLCDACLQSLKNGSEEYLQVSETNSKMRLPESESDVLTFCDSHDETEKHCEHSPTPISERTVRHDNQNGCSSEEIPPTSPLIEDNAEFETDDKPTCSKCGKDLTGCESYLHPQMQDSLPLSSDVEATQLNRDTPDKDFDDVAMHKLLDGNGFAEDSVSNDQETEFQKMYKPGVVEENGYQDKLSDCEETENQNSAKNENEISSQRVPNTLKDIKAENLIKVIHRSKEKNGKLITEIHPIQALVSMFPSLDQPIVFPIPRDREFYNQWARVSNPNDSASSFIKSSSALADDTVADEPNPQNEASETQQNEEKLLEEREEQAPFDPHQELDSIDAIIEYYNNPRAFPITRKQESNQNGNPGVSKSCRDFSSQTSSVLKEKNRSISSTLSPISSSKSSSPSTANSRYLEPVRVKKNNGSRRQDSLVKYSDTSIRRVQNNIWPQRSLTQTNFLKQRKSSDSSNTSEDTNYNGGSKLGKRETTSVQTTKNLAALHDSFLESDLPVEKSPRSKPTIAKMLRESTTLKPRRHHYRPLRQDCMNLHVLDPRYRHSVIYTRIAHDNVVPDKKIKNSGDSLRENKDVLGALDNMINGGTRNELRQNPPLGVSFKDNDLKQGHILDSFTAGEIESNGFKPSRHHTIGNPNLDRLKDVAHVGSESAHHYRKYWTPDSDRQQHAVNGQSRPAAIPRVQFIDLTDLNALYKQLAGSQTSTTEITNATNSPGVRRSNTNAGDVRPLGLPLKVDNDTNR